MDNTYHIDTWLNFVHLLDTQQHAFMDISWHRGCSSVVCVNF